MLKFPKIIYRLIYIGYHFTLFNNSLRARHCCNSARCSRDVRYRKRAKIAQVRINNMSMTPMIILVQLVIFRSRVLVSIRSKHNSNSIAVEFNCDFLGPNLTLSIRDISVAVSFEDFGYRITKQSWFVNVLSSVGLVTTTIIAFHGWDLLVAR